MLAGLLEFSLGRATKKNPVGAILAVRPKTPWVVVGALCVLTGIFILSYYAVIAGWAFGYIGSVFFVMPGIVFAGELLFQDEVQPVPTEQIEELDVIIE